MRKASDMSREDLVCLVEQLQQFAFSDITTPGEQVWNPDVLKEKNLYRMAGEELVSLLELYDLRPEKVMPVTEDAPMADDKGEHAQDTGGDDEIKRFAAEVKETLQTIYGPSDVPDAQHIRGWLSQELRKGQEAVAFSIAVKAAIMNCWGEYARPTAEIAGWLERQWRGQCTAENRVEKLEKDLLVCQTMILNMALEMYGPKSKLSQEEGT